MSYLDTFLLIILAIVIYNNYKHGFILSLRNFLVITLGVIISYFISLGTTPLLYPKIIRSFYLAFLIMFVISFIIMRKLLMKFEIYLMNLLKKHDLFWLNSLLGGVVGFLKVAFITFIVVSIIGVFQINALMKPIFNSEIATSLYSFVRTTTGINLMQTIHNFSLKDSLDKTKKAVEKSQQDLALESPKTNGQNL